MELNIDVLPKLPEDIRPLTFESARKYLKKDMWTVREAVLILSGLDPLNRPFFEDDDANEFWLARAIWQGARLFHKSSQPLPTHQWMQWAIHGPESNKRSTPLPFAEQLQKALDGDYQPLKLLIKHHEAVGNETCVTEIVQSQDPSEMLCDWREYAQKYGQEYKDEQIQRGRHPSQMSIAEYLETRFRNEKISSRSNKPLSAAYIKRHALKGI